MANLYSDQTLEKISQYLKSEQGEVFLNDQEEELLQRLMMAHGLFHTSRYTNIEINRIIRTQFGCSYQTALMAMRAAQIVLGGVTVYNRRYMAALHLDEVSADLLKAREEGDKEMVAKLHATKAKLIELLPADAPIKDITPAVINFNILKTDLPSTLTLQQALANANSLLNRLPSTIIKEEDAG